MTKKHKILWAVLGVALIAASIPAFVVIRKYVDNRMSNFTKMSEIFVYPDMDVEEILAHIDTTAGVIRKGSLHRAFKAEFRDSLPKPGHYTISEGNSSRYVARMINHSWQTPVRMVLSGAIRHKHSIATKISRQMLVDSATVMDALNDSVLLSRFGFNPENVFGLIIPDTYEILWTASIEEILQVQKKALDAFWTDENLAKAEVQNLTPEEVAIVASIVRGESNYVPEYPKIAGVYLNRLKKGMKLQADPTIAFCYGYTLNRILKKHLKVDSPYNTYLHEGLPPAPIYAPGKDAMNAVLNPEGSDNLFFCADPSFNGSHRFAKTYSEHLKNAREFQRALNARIKERRAQKNSL